MINFAETASLPEEQVERLMNLGYEYGVKLPGGILSVTPEAHEYYELAPIIDVVAGGLARKQYNDQRSPVAHTVLVSPNEAQFEELQYEKAHYARHHGAVMLWLAHPERPQEYIKDALAKSADACRSLDTRLINLSDEEVVADALGVEGLRSVRASLPRDQFADMINGLEGTMFNQIMRMRETSYTMDKKRRNMLRTSPQRMNVQTTDSNLGFTHEIVTTRAIYDYAVRRTHTMSEAMFNTYFEGNFADFRGLTVCVGGLG